MPGGGGRDDVAALGSEDRVGDGGQRKLAYFVQLAGSRTNFSGRRDPSRMIYNAVFGSWDGCGLLNSISRQKWAFCGSQVPFPKIYSTASYTTTS